MKTRVVSNTVSPLNGANFQEILKSYKEHRANQLQVAKTFCHIYKCANKNRKLLNDILKGHKEFHSETKQIENLSRSKVAAMLFLGANLSLDRIAALLGYANGSKAGAEIRTGICEFSAELKIHFANDNLVQINPYRNVRPLVAAYNFVKSIKLWSIDPNKYSLPDSQICLSLKELCEVIPWLSGRKDQIEHCIRSFASNGHCKDSRITARLHAWITLDKHGRLLLSVSIYNRELSKRVNKNVFDPRIGTYLIGAAFFNEDKILGAMLLRSKSQALANLRRIYPGIGKRFIKQEALIMIADGAVELGALQEARHLKQIRTKYGKENSKISTTACLNVLSIPSESRANAIKDVSLKDMRASPGLPYALTFGSDINKARILITKETTQILAQTGSFLGSPLILAGLKNSGGKQIRLGELILTVLKSSKAPHFIFESAKPKKNSVETNVWGKDAISWLQNDHPRTPYGELKIAVIHTFKKKSSHSYITIGGLHFTLIKFPHSIKEVIVQPATIKINGKNKRILILKNNEGEFVGFVISKKIASKNKIFAITQKGQLKDVKDLRKHYAELEKQVS